MCNTNKKLILQIDQTKHNRIQSTSIEIVTELPSGARLVKNQLIMNCSWTHSVQMEWDLNLSVLLRISCECSLKHLYTTQITPKWFRLLPFFANMKFVLYLETITNSIHFVIISLCFFVGKMMIFVYVLSCWSDALLI